MYIHMIEDNKPLTDDLIGGLRQIRADLAGAAKLVDEMSAIVDDLKAERRNVNVNNNDQRN